MPCNPTDKNAFLHWIFSIESYILIMQKGEINKMTITNKQINKLILNKSRPITLPKIYNFCSNKYKN